MALAMFEYVAEQLASSTTSGMTVLAQPTPATPVRLFVSAAAAPATAVPCPPLHPVSDVLLVPVRKFQPGINFAARSGCVPSAPESITAIGTPDEPVVILHALAACILARCHSDAKSGSLGMAAACAIKSRSTNVNRPDRCSAWLTASSAGSGTSSTTTLMPSIL